MDAKSSSPHPGMLRSTMVVGAFTLFGNVTGILVEIAIAAHLGLSKSSDTFYVAFTAPYVITDLIAATGQFSLVPFFSSLAARHTPEEQRRGFSYAVTMFLLSLTAIALIGVVIGPWVVRAIAPGFTAAESALAGQLTRWLFIVIIPAGVAEVCRSLLLSRRHFAFPSLGGLIRNSIVIASILVLFPRYGLSSIVLGYLAGYLMQFAVLAIQLAVVYPVRFSLTLTGSGEAFSRFRGAGAAQVGVALGWQGVVIIERVIASFLPPGTLTALNYGFKILGTLVDLLAGSVGTAALPTLSHSVAHQDSAEERRTFQSVLHISLALVAPAMVFCLMLSPEIIRLVFEHGNFTRFMTGLMATVFFYYSLSLACFAALRILNFYLFARNEAAGFLRLSLFQYGLTVAFDLFYVGVLRLGPRGIPLGLLTSLCIVLGIVYARNLSGLRLMLDSKLAMFSFKNLFAAGLTTLAVLGLSRRLASSATGVQNFDFLLIVCSLGSVVYFATLAATRAFTFSRPGSFFQGGKQA